MSHTKFASDYSATVGTYSCNTEKWKAIPEPVIISTDKTKYALGESINLTWKYVLPVESDINRISIVPSGTLNWRTGIGANIDHGPNPQTEGTTQLTLDSNTTPGMYDIIYYF